MAAMALPLLALLTGLAACTNGRHVSRAIEELINDQQASEVRLSELTRFQWESLYLFGSYTPRERICETLGIGSGECPRRIPFDWVDEGRTAMVFMTQRRLSHLEQHANWKGGDFSPLPSGALTPGTAVFRVVRERTASTGESHVRLILKWD